MLGASQKPVKVLEDSPGHVRSPLQVDLFPSLEILVNPF